MHLYSDTKQAVVLKITSADVDIIICYICIYSGTPASLSINVVYNSFILGTIHGTKQESLLCHHYSVHASEGRRRHTCSQSMHK